MATLTQQQPSQKERNSLGFPEGWAPFSPVPFGGMNYDSSRIGIGDTEFWWRENLIRVGDMRLASVPDVGTALYTSTKTIIHKFWYFIGPNAYVAVFFSDGTATQVAWPSGVTTTISSVPNTFYNSATGNLPACVQWGVQYLVISNNNTKNDYWIWDGTVLYAAGTLAPVVTVTFNGSGYTSQPTITAYGGFGTGATFTSTVDANGVSTVQIINPGSGYGLTDVPQLRFTGGGSDDAAQLTASLNAGAVTSVAVTANGTGYTTASVNFTGGGGTGAAATATVSTGNVIAVNINAGGSAYTAATVSFSGGGGTGAAATAVISGGSVIDIDMTNQGSGYTSVPSVTISGDGSGATGTAVTSAFGVTQIIVTNGGSGYTSAPGVTITGDGTGATGTAFITSGGVGSVTVTAGGTGYRRPPLLTLVGGGGAGATALAFLTATSLAQVDVTNGGLGYFHPPTIVIDPPISGTQATATANVTSGVITSITLTNAGSGYTRLPEVTIVPDWRDTSGVAAVVLNNQGSGYSSNPTVTISGGGAASNAIATAIVQNGHVIEYVIQYAGYGYTSNPKVTVSGGGGSGATATAVIQTGAASSLVSPASASAQLVPTSIGSVVMQAEGSGYTTAPAVEITPGANNAAAATISLMPFGVSGRSIASFQQRIWLAYPFQKIANLFTEGTLLLTAPGSLTDLATSDGGLIFQSSSSFLGSGFQSLAVVGDYLYAISNSSVDVISNVQTTGTPPATTFSDNNTDPQTGTPYPRTVQNFSRTALITNALGVFGIYGGAVTKLSKKLDQLFQNAVLPPTAGALTPSAAVGTILGQKVYCVLLTINDKVWGGTRNVLVTWDEQDFFVTTQSPNLTFITTQNINSEPQAWGTDGNSIFPLFQTSTGKNSVRLATKLYGGNTFPAVKQSLGVHLVAVDTSTGQSGVSLSTFNLDTENGSQASGLLPVNLSGKPIIGWDPGVDYGCFLGASFISSSVSWELQHFVLGYRNFWSGYGSPPSTETS